MSHGNARLNQLGRELLVERVIDEGWAVAHAAKAAVSHQVDLSELPLAVLQGFNPRIEKDVFDVLSLRGSLNARDVLGGTAPKQVRLQLERHRARLT